ncbi:MAG: hypothetical protein M0Q22_15245 [Sulfuritalea sp.]|jgi:hypothetical protein|nr:hypothetical protein [Sulfuritalea sp.]
MKRQRGVNKLEFAVIVCIFGVLALVFLERVERVQIDAERTEVQLTIRNLRQGMQLAVGELIMHGEEQRLPELAAANPVRFLEKQPPGYEGEATFPSQPGGWVFDPIHQEIAYRPRLPQAFDGRDELRWRYRSFSFGPDRLGGLRLVETE